MADKRDYYEVLGVDKNAISLIKKYIPKYVEITTVNNYSIFTVVFNDRNGKEAFRVPIAQSPIILKEGILMLDGYAPFILSGKPTYDKSNTKLITIGELRKKYPWLTFTNEAGTVMYTGQLDDIKIAEDAVAFEKRNDGKTFLTVSGIRLADNERNSLWQSSIKDGKLWLGTNADKVSKIGIQRLIESTDDILLYYIAIDYLKTFDEDCKNFLQSRGWNVATRKNVISKLKEMTKEDAWDVNILKQDKPDWKDYFSALGVANRRSEPISWMQNERIMADLFGEILKNPKNHERAWQRLHAKFNNLSNRSFGLIFKIDPTHQFVIHQDKDTPTKLYIKRFVNGVPGDIITQVQTDGKVSAFKEFIMEGVQAALNLAGLNINDFDSTNLRVSGLNITWKSKNYNQPYYNQDSSLSSLFNIIYPFDISQISNYLSERFKNGLYGNFPADDRSMENSVFHASKFRENDVTFASEWRGEFITIDENDIKSLSSEDPNQVADVLSDGRHMIDNIVETASKFTSKDYLDEIQQKYENILAQYDNITNSELDILLMNMMSEINNHLLSNSTSKRTSIINFDEDHSRIVVESKDSKNEAYSNLIRNVYGVELDANNLKIDQYSLSRVDVIAGEQIEGRQVNYVFYEEEGKLKVLRTLNYDNWKNIISLIDNWRNSIPQESETDTNDTYRIFRRELNSIRVYFEHLLTNSVRNDEAKKYWEVISKYLKDLQEYDNAQNIQSALEQYLISRINDNEC